MKHLPTAILIATLALASSGCSSIATIDIRNPDRLSANETRYPGNATIYVFRGSNAAAALWSFPVEIDGVKVGSVRRETYLAIPAKPGAHWLTTKCPALCGIPGFKANLEVSAGKSYYFTFEPEYSSTMTYTVTSAELRQIDKRFADRLIESYEMSELKTD